MTNKMFWTLLLTILLNAAALYVCLEKINEQKTESDFLIQQLIQATTERDNWKVKAERKMSYEYTFPAQIQCTDPMNCVRTD